VRALRGGREARRAADAGRCVGGSVHESPAALWDNDLIRLLEQIHPERDRVMILLSFKAGLRAKEIAELTWSMVTDASGEIGEAIALPNSAAKGKNGGRAIPLHDELREAC
jgi:integrase